jgi:superfamily II DNA or RNA helicase
MNTSSYFYQHSSTVIQRLYNRKTKLYSHQQEALLKLFEMGANGELLPENRQPDSGAAFFLVGVGCGKTVVLQAAPYILGRFIQGKQVIFLSHNCTLRQRVMEDFPIKKLPRGKVEPDLREWELYKRGLLNETTPPPKILELSAESYSDVNFLLDKVDILVTNWQFLKNLVSRGDIDPENVGLIVVDEAHHSAASSYQSIFNYFKHASLVFLTGTRHRGDRENLPYVRYMVEQCEELNGQTILKKSPRTDFEFTIQDAWKLEIPIIKRVTFSPAKSDGFKVEENGKEVQYTAEQFYEKAEKERSWFHECVLADSFCKPVLDRAVEVLKLKREGGKPHRMIIRALNIKHAYRLRELCENYPLLNGRVGLVHSANDEYDPEGRPSEIFNKFSRDEYIALIHVSMVGEGFNVPYASVSVPLCIMRSTQKAEQEFGRIIRKVDGTYPKDNDWGDFQSDNSAVVVTHEALGISELFEQFIQGEEHIVIEDDTATATDIVRHRILQDSYQAGDAVLRLNNTDGLSNDDEILVQVRDSQGQDQTLIFSVENVIDKETLGVFPLLVDIPQGSLARKAASREENGSEFIGHLGLRWYLRIDGKDISVEEYRRQKALEQRKLTENEKGEIVTLQGERIQDYPPEIRQMVFDLLTQEEEKVDIPFQNVEVSALPGQSKKGLQEYHRKRIQKFVIEISSLTLDGRRGRNLIDNPLDSLKECIGRAASDNEKLLHEAIFRCVKRKTSKKWSEHRTEEEFESAVQIAFEKIEEVREELKARRRSKGL